ncbi:MAG: plasma-membrane proton-efflux P-type ATPase [Phycisphaerae bacterium]|nr:plasma-membrane proton-efflux P-type ATPase [Phycisphaerae bacterium]
MPGDAAPDNSVASTPAPTAEPPTEPPGLTTAEAARLLAEHGPNEVLEQRRHPVRTLLAKFWGLSAWMLEVIMVVSALLGKYEDLAIVGGLLIVNAVVSFVQDRRAAGVVEALRRRLQVNARVRRDGRWTLLPARELAPGDVVRVRTGDIVPADLTLTSGTVSVDQSALTGESAEVDKAAGDAAPSGAAVRRGEVVGVVAQTGARTLFGRTTELVQRATPKLHVDAVVGRVVRWLFAITGVLIGVVAALAAVRGIPLLEVSSLLLVLLMSAVPVALPVMFTFSMALGARELARHGVLVTRLSAAEDAATMDVLCVDKTGTITMNQLAVRSVTPLGDATQADVLAAGAMASQEANQDPIDLAFLAAARATEAGVQAHAATPVSFTPFDVATRRTEAVVLIDGRRVRAVKGAVRSVAEVCGLDAGAVAALESRVAESARHGLRTLAVARGEGESAPELLGLVAMEDPPRPDARAMVLALRDLGVSVKMLTGDALAVGQEIATRVGLGPIRRASEVRAEASAGGGFSGGDPLGGADGLAEVYPEDKYTVVRRLQGAGRVTGMTGDGVNDAPPLRQAEVGIAVAGATDVARGAASVVLTDPGLANIVTLVSQGRSIYQRILTWIVNKISRTIFKSAFVAVAFVVSGHFVVSAFAMLLLTFLTDFAKIALATDRVRWSRKPETWNIGPLVWVAAALGVLMVVEALLLLWLCWRPWSLGERMGDLHAFSFLTLLFFGVWSVVSARERRWCWASRPSAALAAALGVELALGATIGLLGFASLAPLAWWRVLAILGYAAACCLLVNDAAKVLLMRRLVPETEGTVE